MSRRALLVVALAAAAWAWPAGAQAHSPSAPLTIKATVLIETILAAPVGLLGSLILVGLAVDFNMDAVSNFNDVITLGAAGAGSSGRQDISERIDEILASEAGR